MRKLRPGDLPAVVALGTAVRSWMVCTTPLVPSVNGAYYFVHARSLREKGSLGIPDFPLTFVLHAVIADGSVVRLRCRDAPRLDRGVDLYASTWRATIKR